MPILKAYCNVCNLWLNSSNQLLAHQAGRAHKRREMIGLGFNCDQTRSLTHLAANQENSSKITPQSNTQNGTTQRDENMGQNNTCGIKNQMGEGYFCDICMVQLTSRSQADMHFEGSKHKKVLAVIAGKQDEVQYEGVKRMAEDACDICNVPLSSKAVADAHYAGSKHEKKMKLSQSLRANPALGFSNDRTQSTSTTTTIASIPSHSPQIVSSSSITIVPVSPGSVGLQQKRSVGSSLYCSFCGVNVNSRQQMDAHWQGVKHKNNVNGLLPQTKNMFSSVRTVPTHVNTGHVFSHYRSQNGQAAFRTGQSMSYVSHQF